MEDGITIFDPDGAQNFPFTALVEGLLGGVGRCVYPDGSEQFCDEGEGDEEDLVFSPRLQPCALEDFCRQNIAYYEAFYERHADALNKLSRVAMPSFWPVDARV